jgi:hypothetical protein
VQSFKISGTELAPTPVVVCNLPSLKTRWGGTYYDGQLGWATLKKNHVVFGYHPSIFFFCPTGPSQLIEKAFRTAGFYELQLFPQGSAYHLPMIINGFSARMCLDSGTMFTSVSAWFAQRHITEIKGRLPNTVGLDNGKLLSRPLQPDSLALASFAIRPFIIQEVNSPQYRTSDANSDGIDGVLGYDLMGQFYSFIDFGNDRLFLQRSER